MVNELTDALTEKLNFNQHQNIRRKGAQPQEIHPHRGEGRPLYEAIRRDKGVNSPQGIPARFAAAN